MTPIDDLPSTYPRELVHRMIELAEEEADLVIDLLEEMRIIPPMSRCSMLPRAFFLLLGAAMRLSVWERQGVDHPGGGLPSAREAVLGVLAEAVARAEDPSMPASVTPLSRVVNRLKYDRLAWLGPRALGAEILLKTPDDDDLVAAMARFLWDNRGAVLTTEGPSR